MIKEFFTLPDPDLSQESSVDPMGLQVIWTTYGQAIFSEKLTTIANDLRVFTFNLFHHYIINNLFKDHAEEMQTAKAYYKSWQTEADIKSGLLMFLEDMVTWIFFLKEEESDIDIDKLGILGLTKARRAFNSENPERIYLAANKRSGLLKNQINLGMSGRYKGPMINMEFFDRSFCYLPKTWEQVEKFMSKWAEAKELESQISKLITGVIFESSKKDSPQISLEELKRQRLWKQVAEGYLKCFGKKKLPRDVRNYWEDKLGLKSGAPKALFDEIASLDGNEYIDHATVFNRARKEVRNEPGELQKLNDILTIEPLLSHSEYLLKCLSQQSVKTLADINNELILLRGEIRKACNFSIPDAHPRLLELQRVMLFDGSVTDWVNAVLIYHKKVMDQRGGNMWVELDDKGAFRHYFCASLPEYINTVPAYLESDIWLHTYYLETVRSIHNGLN
jgi:hypothetical protein